RLGEDEADHRSRLDHRALVFGERVEAGREERLNRRRDVEAREVLRRAPRVALDAQVPAIDQHRQEVLGKEGIALGREDDPLSHTTTRGRSRASAESSLRAPQKSSSIGNVSRERPIAAATRSTIAAASAPATQALRRARAASGGSSAAISAASRATSDRGQNV